MTPAPELTEAAARTDLDEAQEIAERGSMKLHLADAHLERTRQHLEAGDAEAARQHLERARGLVDETGYERRRREVENLARHPGA